MSNSELLEKLKDAEWKGSDFDKFKAHCDIAFSHLNIYHPMQQAYVYATVEWETAKTFNPVREAYWTSENWRKSNLRYYPWYGRGHVQLTWERNYQKVDDEFDLKGKLLENPDLLIEDYALSVAMSVTGMKQGWFTGRNLDKYFNKRRADFYKARYIINGKDKRAEIAQLAIKYTNLLPKLNWENIA